MDFSRSPLALVLAVLVGLCACTSSDSDPEPDAGLDAAVPGDADVPSDAGDDSAVDAGEEYLGLKQPENGFQVRSRGATIPAGGDVEYCEVAELPGDPSDTYYVKAIELGNAPLSHHLFLTAPEPGGVADQKIRELEIGDKVPCLSGQQAFGDIDHPTVYGIQQPYGGLIFPEGVGRIFHGGQRIVFDYHYYNTTEEPAEARSVVNFHVTDKATIEHIAEGVAFTNWTIDTPAGASASFKGKCTFTEDVMVAGLARHTHRWGTDFSVWFEGGDQDGEHIWTTNDWQHDINFPFDEPRLMKAGEGFSFECSYHNTEDYALRFGTNATDEMCILFSLMWGAGDELNVPKQDCDITWVDDDGMGHSANEGVPPPSESDRALCAMGSGDSPTECEQCQCDSCATSIVACYLDAECMPLITCAGDDTCDLATAIDEHSSGTGLLQQVLGCMTSECSICE